VVNKQASDNVTLGADAKEEAASEGGR